MFRSSKFLIESPNKKMKVTVNVIPKVKFFRELQIGEYYSHFPNTKDPMIWRKLSHEKVGNTVQFNSGLTSTTHFEDEVSVFTIDEVKGHF